MKTAVKICGLTRHADARAAVDAGADYLGIVFAPSSPRRRDADAAREIWQDLSAVRAGVFVNEAADRIRSLSRELGLGVVQLHGSEDPELALELVADGGPEIWKAVRLRRAVDLDRALDRYADRVDGILLEGWTARGVGGVGAAFDWEWAGTRRSDWPSGVKLILAGGLHAGNVSAAIAALRPDVVDVSSGVEIAPGAKDVEAVHAFVAAVSGARRG